MHEIIAKRPVGRPKGSTMGIMERIERFKISELCAEATKDVVALWTGMVKNPECPWILRLAAADRLMNRAFGLPVRPIEVDSTSTDVSLKKIIHEVRWMSPDPNDRSVETIPEPD
jgi:hypothetical protein